MEIFLEGLGTGIMITIGGSIVLGVGIMRYLKSHPERIYTAIVRRKSNNDSTRSN